MPEGRFPSRKRIGDGNSQVSLPGQPLVISFACSHDGQKSGNCVRSTELSQQTHGMLSASFFVFVRRIAAKVVGQQQHLRAILIRPSVSVGFVGHDVKTGVFRFQSAFFDVNGGIGQSDRSHRKKVGCNQENDCGKWTRFHCSIAGGVWSCMEEKSRWSVCDLPRIDRENRSPNAVDVATRQVALRVRSDSEHQQPFN